jgi:hypothetical protein
VNAALESSSRAAVEIAFSASNQAGMTLRVSQIPDDYPYTGWLDTRPAKVGALFNFAVGCGVQDKLWSNAAHALAHNKSSTYASSGVSPECPASSATVRDEGRQVTAAIVQGVTTGISAGGLSVPNQARVIPSL